VYETERLRDRAQPGKVDANAWANQRRGAESCGQNEKESSQLDMAAVSTRTSLQCTPDLQPWTDVLGRNYWVGLAKIHGLVGRDRTNLRDRTPTLRRRSPCVNTCEMSGCGGCGRLRRPTRCLTDRPAISKWPW
jgi:hypothetical protein